jgi:hypothetical protein
MTNHREHNYLLLRQKASAVVRDFFNKNGNFSYLDPTYIDQLRSNYANTPYRFRYVVQKYFMNVTFNFSSMPFKYALPVFDFYLRKRGNLNYKLI